MTLLIITDHLWVKKFKDNTDKYSDGALSI